jgi:cell division septation protein DedD
MNRLNKQIKTLLLKHGCVIIPDFGGLLLQTAPAYNTDNNLFYPEKREIVFNPTLTHDDGLLADSYMKDYSLDFEEAREHVYSDASFIIDTLDSDSDYKIDLVGSFSKENNKLVFSPNNEREFIFNAPFYGLPIFYFLSLAARKKSVNPVFMLDESDKESLDISEINEEDNSDDNKKKKDRNTIFSIPVTKSFVKVVLSLAAVLLLFLLLSTPVKEVNGNSYSASFVPNEVMPKKNADMIVSDAFNETTFTPPFEKSDSTASRKDELAEAKKDDNANAIESEAIVSSSDVSDTKNNTVEKTAKKEKTESTTPKSNTSAKNASNNNYKYYVIIGSYITKSQANIHIQNLKGKDFENAGLYVSDGRVRVYAGRFNNENSANDFLKKVRQNKGHAQAWLYTVN